MWESRRSSYDPGDSIRPTQNLPSQNVSLPEPSPISNFFEYIRVAFGGIIDGLHASSKVRRVAGDGSAKILLAGKIALA